MSPDLTQPTIIVTGMHRSGTSLVASLLQSAGLDIGSNLLPANDGNPEGYFENVDFLNFHISLLDSIGVNSAGWTIENDLFIPDYFKNVAKELVEKNASHSSAWGWKDPRTTLFLDFWGQLLPNARFVFAYRSPVEVLDSLYRRATLDSPDRVFFHHPEFPLKIWQNYNQQILDFYEKYPDKCLLVGIDAIIANPEQLQNLLQDKLAIQLNNEIDLGRYRHSLMKSCELGANHTFSIQQFFPDVWQVYLTLNDKADLPLLQSLSSEEQSSSPTSIFQNWLETYHLNRQAAAYRSETEATIEALQQQLQEAATKETDARTQWEALSKEMQTLLKNRDLTEQHIYTQDELIRQLREDGYEHQRLLGYAQGESEHLQSRLAQAQEVLQQRQEELEHCQNELQHCQSELHQHQSELQQAQHKVLDAKETLKMVRDRRKQMRIRLQEGINQLTAQRDEYANRITAMESSKFWKFRRRWARIKQALGSRETVEWQPQAPEPSITVPMVIKQHQPKTGKKDGSLHQDSSSPVGQNSAPPEHVSPSPLPPAPALTDYDQWQIHNFPRPSDLQRMAEIVEGFTYKPLISIIVPTYNTPEQFLREAIDSVIDQVYPYWELCIADDASPKPHVRQILEEYVAKDNRIRVKYREENGHISHCSNTALELATGEFIALLDHDDLITPDALYEMAALLNRHPEADMIYSDEDKIDQESGALRDPFFKPDWCPDSFLARMYTCHFGLYRRSIIKRIKGFRPGYEGSQDYDLVLRFTEHTSRIFHIPRILYHWRMHPQSTAGSSEAKPYAFIAAQKAITEAIARRGEPGTVSMAPNMPGFYSIRYEIKSYDLVSILIPTKDLSNLLGRCLESIFSKTTYQNYEVILIDNGSVEKETTDLIQRWTEKEPDRFRSYLFDHPFNYSQINNFAAANARGKYLLFLNNDTEIITPDWIERMVEQAQRPSIGAVGTMLLYPDNTVQHAGVVLGLGGAAGHCFVNQPADSFGHFGQLAAINNYSAVTAACLMCRKEVFESVSGFEENLPVAFNDVDLCLKFHDRGLRNIYLNHVRLYHYESKTRGQEDTPEKHARFMQDSEYMRTKWGKLIDRDPCHSPNLSLRYSDFRIIQPDEQGILNSAIAGMANQVQYLQQQRDIKHGKLVRARTRVKSLRAQLDKALSNLEQTDQQLKAAEACTAAMETSKFWKLRTRWMRVKQLFTGLAGEQ